MACEAERQPRASGVSRSQNKREFEEGGIGCFLKFISLIHLLLHCLEIPTVIILTVKTY